MGTLFSGIPVDASGYLQINIAAQGLSPIVVVDQATSATGAAVPAKASYFGGNKSGNLVGVLLDASGNLQVAVENTVTVSGTVTANQGTSPWVVAGGLTHNSAAPAANNVGALTAVASASAPTYSAGDQVLLSVDLAGNLRVNSTGGSGTQYLNGAAVASGSLETTVASGYDGANVRALTTDTLGNLTTRPAVPVTQLSTPVVINTNTTGNNFIIAGVSGKTIRIMAIDLQVSGIVGGTPTTVTFKDGTTTSLTGPYAFLNGGSFTKDFSGEPWYICSTSGASSGFNINQSGTAQLSGTIWYTIS